MRTMKELELRKAAGLLAPAEFARRLEERGERERAERLLRLDQVLELKRVRVLARRQRARDRKLPAAEGEVGGRSVPSVQPGELGGEGQASVRGGVDGERGGPVHAGKPVSGHAPSISKARAVQPVATLPVAVWRRVEFREEGTMRECATGLKERGIRVKIRGLVMLWEDGD